MAYSLSKIRRRLLSAAMGILYTSVFLLSPLVTPPANAAGNGVNVILMIGDGMGWEAARAAAIANGAPLYKDGKGTGLNMQKLSGYTYATTYGTSVAGATGNSALTTTNPITGASPLRTGFVFDPKLNPGSAARNPAGTAAVACQNGAGTSGNGGNIVGYEPAKGGPNPWTPISPELSSDREYIKCSYPDSANTASTLYTGVKSYNNAMSVDLYEKAAPETILQTANRLGKSTGVVTSVPITHATPGAAVATVNRRNKYDNDFPALDNILQQAIRKETTNTYDRKGIKPFLPTVMIGGGHPLDFQNATNQTTTQPSGDAAYTYIKPSTYAALKYNPNNNPYGYTFLERDGNVTYTNDLSKIKDGGDELLATSLKLDPNKGDRLLGLYGARGQNGNIPFLTANRDYSNTGLDAFSVYSTAAAGSSATSNGPQVPKPDAIRPLANGIDNGRGETPAQFIAKEVKANPTLSEMTQAALNVLGKDKDGFWLMVEGGDIDWSLHDDNMDNLIGTMYSFDDAVKTVIDWVGQNGGWKKNALIVTADHDHYLTLGDKFPDLLKANGAEALTYAKHNPAEAGHFFGSEPAVKYGWGTHTNRMVPVYYQGEALNLVQFIGKPVDYVDAPTDGAKKTYQIPGVPNAIDQQHIYKAMMAAIGA
ncbi:MAG: alkaline phosphatase [Alkalinema sp. RU_4_3]|nr:alkaline phosphatase [Alkalinema sp. RU_4_3]